jgi:UDP-2,4-diacetamido-2,4,6-trideoxy-beta-L-altropyranose hydrolase
LKIVFRVDASLTMGTGHVMRCLTLADALTAEGADCHFICREHPGHLATHIRSKGYRVSLLAVAPNTPDSAAMKDELVLAHAHWLGGSWQQDVASCLPLLEHQQPDWLVVDHYAIDSRWEMALKPYYRKLMVIDDLADRTHVCQLLLDQTFGRNAQDYQRKTPANCTVLCGSQYALLRPEFAALRGYSLKRRENPKLEQLLITMGGVDKDNATELVLAALEGTTLPTNCSITVIMGATAPWLEAVRIQASKMRWPTKVMVNTSDMAQLMADADLCIGAAGSTSWERCTLGLPCILLCLADNQRMSIQTLSNDGVALALEIDSLLTFGTNSLEAQLIKARKNAAIMIEKAASVADGEGSRRLVRAMLNA